LEQERESLGAKIEASKSEWVMTKALRANSTEDERRMMRDLAKNHVRRKSGGI
jgi:hypothetical protein